MVTILLMLMFNILWFFKFKRSYMDGVMFRDFTSSILIYGYNLACILAGLSGISI